MVSNNLPMDSRPVAERIDAFICCIACAIATMVFGATDVSAQPLTPAPLDGRVISSVDRFYPGFIEILDTRDAPSLARLARVLVANPSRDSLVVLLWMLQYCPSWADGNGEAAVQLKTVARAVGTLPVAPVSSALLRGNAGQRLAAAILLSDSSDLIASNERQKLERTLIAALADADLRVREWIAEPLRALATPAANVALMRAVSTRDVSEMLYWRATGQRRSFTPQVSASTFSPATVAALKAIAPWFTGSLNSFDEQSLAQLRLTLQRSSDPETTPVLVWLLVNEPGNQWFLPQVLATPQRVSRLPLGELTSLLVTADPDHRSSIAELLKRALALKEVPDSSVNELIQGLMSHRLDPRPDVRFNVLTILASAIKRRGPPFTGASETARELGDLVRGRDLTSSERSNAIYALGLVADRTSLPLFEQMARSIDINPQVREQAARTYVSLSMPADPAVERRRLLWEQPDTAFEARVRTEGKIALPLAWQALTTGSNADRRAAAALLGWYRDARSIRPILGALDAKPGALTKEQLLFDLNMILLTEGSPANREQSNALAAAHLEWLYGKLVDQTIGTDIRNLAVAAERIAVSPERVVVPFSVALSAETSAAPGEPRRQVSATAIASESREAFLAAVAKNEYGVAIHAITVAEGIARVATTLYLPRRGAVNQVWISLYRAERGRWVRVPGPSEPVLPPMLNEFNFPTESNLMPTINRDYGASDPLKALRLDVTMERIRGDLKAIESLARGGDFSVGFGTIDASYVPLLERYRRSDDPPERYAAEFQWGRLTGRPNVELWMDAFTNQRGTPFQTMAQQVIGTYAATQVKSEGRQLAGPERDELVTAAVNPDPVDSRLLPRQVPQQENIRRVQASARFALVDARFGTDPLGSSGYSMLFERRGERWVFLFVVGGWIS
jgi:hypothetical protein